MLLKSIRAPAAWEQGDIASILKFNFSGLNGQIRRDVSVYKIEPADLVRMHAEHQASSGLQEAQTSKWLDVTGILQNTRQAPGNPWFQFLSGVHYSEDMPDDRAVETLARRLLALFKQGALTVTRPDVRTYVQQRKAQRDREWLDFFANAPHGPRWAKL